MCPIPEATDRSVAVADDEEEAAPPVLAAEPPVLAAEPPAEPEAPGEVEDPVAELQAIDAFNSMEDGQPGAPGMLEFALAVGADHGFGADFGFGFAPELGYTPRSPSRFVENSQFAGGVEFEGDADVLEPALNLAWGQRWLSNHDGGTWVPTIGGMTEVNLPFAGGFGPGLEGDNISETLTLAEEVGPGAAYFNGVATAMLGADPDTRHLILTARAGYKWIALEDKLTFIMDYVHAQGEGLSSRPQNTAEVSMAWTVGEHLTLGPGLVFGLDDNPETPRVGGGVVLLLE